ncbi:uncharacterized protein LOC111040273 [Myzus persicae]|uniref:uncharacterized protein LOC111040273 n=1 Tax=Myzus persicae TaxID=13164 RepID=UPI000B934702|nr:uncharacterized protein LOC111040273 [Myzus persicae]
MSNLPSPIATDDSALELVRIFERCTEILQSTGLDDQFAATLRPRPVSDLAEDPIILAMYNRGWDDWTAGINLVHSSTKGIRTRSLSELEYMELLDLHLRTRILLEREGGLSNVFERVWAIVGLFSMDKIRNSPILWAAYTRGWDDHRNESDLDFN